MEFLCLFFRFRCFVIFTTDAVDEYLYESVDNVDTADNRPTAAQRTRPPKLERQSALDHELAPSSSLNDNANNRTEP